MLLVGTFVGTLVGSAGATTFDGGVGVRRTDGDLAGLHVFGGVRPAPALRIEVGGYVRVKADVVSDLDRVLVAIAYDTNPDTTFRAPISVDRASLEALAVWSIVGRPANDGLSGGLLLTGGLSARVRSDYFAGVSPAYAAGDYAADPVALSEAGAHLAIGPAIGFGVEALYGHFGLRWSVLLRGALEPEPDYGTDAPPTNEITGSVVQTLDVVAAW